MADRVLFLENIKGHKVLQSYNVDYSHDFYVNTSYEDLGNGKYLIKGTFGFDSVENNTRPIDGIKDIAIRLYIDQEPFGDVLNISANYYVNYYEKVSIYGNFEMEVELESSPEIIEADVGGFQMWELNRELSYIGECQLGENGYNLAFSIDGTKDSAKIVVYSNIKNAIKPFSVVYHENTQTWWIVSNDKVERYLNEQDALGNPTYIYKHSLQLEGAIELLNARDLTDIGFNQYKYTIEQFTRRLFKMSNFEFDSEDINIITNDSIDISYLIDYIKTYENYTLLSALNDLYSGYNCAVKLNFVLNSSNVIIGCNLVIVPKTGIVESEIPTIENTFTEVDEIKQLHKSSYGTSIVSNTDNVVSSITKRYPSTGGIKLYSNEYNVERTNAVIKLPSKAFRVEEVNMFMTIRLALQYWSNNDWHYAYDDYGGYFNVADTGNIRNKLNIVKNYCSTHFGNFDANDFETKKQSMIRTIQKIGTMTFKDGAKFNPQNKNLYYEDGSHIKTVRLPIGSSYYNMRVAVMDKTLGNSVSTISGTPVANQTYTSKGGIIKWERGSDEVFCFEWLDCRVRLTETDFGVDNNIIYWWNQGGNAYRIIVAAGERTSNFEITQQYFSGEQNKQMPLFAVKYIPMTDIKIKLDNNGTDNNIHLYNQNGKLTDANAFSKMLNSYKKEIESENITRYLVSTSYSSMPTIGQIYYNDNGKKYVVSNASYMFYKNEDGYIVYGEYNLTLNVATKSLLTSPNTNIRDYGIPQKNNIARKQLYRDFYEFSFTYDLDSDENYYLPIENVLKIDTQQTEPISHTGIMKITYDEPVNGNLNYYYQLDTTVYLFKKCIYEVLEFKDNNIIGYDAQNTNTGFDVSRVFTGTYQLINTPISYVDKNGNFKDIAISMCNANQITKIYNSYQSSVGYGNNDTISLQNMCLFVPQAVYDLSLQNQDYSIVEENYNKDALEVPVFEYCCQIDDTEDVEVYEDILVSSENQIVIYVAKLFDPNTKSFINCGSITNEDMIIERSDSELDGYDYDIEIYNNWEQGNSYGVEMKYGVDANGRKLFSPRIYASGGNIIHTTNDATQYYNEPLDFAFRIPKETLVNKDIVIYKVVISVGSKNTIPFAILNSTPMFIIHAPQNDNFGIDVDIPQGTQRNNTLSVYVNHYKLK